VLTSANTQWGVAYFMRGTDATTGELALVPTQDLSNIDGLPARTGVKKHHHHHP
jgi:hypothetical protein